MNTPTLPNKPFPRSENASARATQPVRLAAAEESAICGLIERMQSGDREAAATFITRYGSRVRRRVRGKLGPAMRRIFDSEEILSTVGRRLDLYVRNGRLEAAGEEQLWTLIFKMADNAIIDKLRILRRLEHVESSDSEFAQQLLLRLRQAEHDQPEGAEAVIEEALLITKDVIDRKILMLWLSGQAQKEIADELEMTEAALWKRWQRIKERLRMHFAEDGEH